MIFSVLVHVTQKNHSMKYVCRKELNQQDSIRTYRIEIKILRFFEIHAFESGGSVFLIFYIGFPTKISLTTDAFGRRLASPLMAEMCTNNALEIISSSSW